MSFLPAYTFSGDAHWKKGLAAALGTSRQFRSDDGIEVPGIPGDVHLLAACDGELWFVDGTAHLRIGDVRGPVIADPIALTVGPSRVWVLAGDALLQFDRRTGQQLLELPCERAFSMAGDGKDGVWVLRNTESVDADGRMQPHRQAVHIAADGHARPAPILLPASVAQLAAAGDALLTLDDDRLARITGQTWSFLISDALYGGRPEWTSFTAQNIVSGQRFVLVAGIWGDKQRGAVLVDNQGALTGMLKWQSGIAPGLVALDGADLLALFDGLRRFNGLPTGGSVKLTPGLIPEAIRGTWLHAEVEARLPLGATLGLRWAPVVDPSLAATAGHIIAEHNSPSPQALRIASVERLLSGLWSDTVAYQGLEHPEGEPAPLERFSFPLYAAEPGSTIFVELRLETDGVAPELVRLSVVHDSEGLMRYLPAIYRGEGDGDATMRRMVGVLETTTHGIDETISNLHTRLDPEKTAPARLPALAAMLGLPFDEALPEPMQRALVAAGPQILEARGTRAGLEALLRALFPHRPWRIVDRAADLLAMTLNIATLPGLLLGPTSRQPKLNARLILNKTRLCPPSGGDNGLVRPPAEIAVTIPATLVERRKLGAALRQMLTALLPAGLTLRLGWSAWREGMTGAAADVLTVVDSPDDLRIARGQALGAARIGGRRDLEFHPMASCRSGTACCEN